VAAQGNAFQGDGFQIGVAGAAAGETITVDKWLTDSPRPLRKVLPTALAAAIGFTGVFVIPPRAEALAPAPIRANPRPPSVLVVPEKVDTQAATLTSSPRPFFRTSRPPSDGAVAFVQLDVALYGWETYSPAPLATSTLVLSGGVEVSPVETPFAAAVSMPVTFDRVVIYQSLAFVAPFDVAPPAETVTVDKWLGYNVNPATPRRVPSSALAFVPLDVALYGWQTDSPRPRRLGRPLQIADPLAWGVFTPAAPVETITLDKWTTDSPRPKPAPPRPPSSVVWHPDTPAAVTPPVTQPPSGGGHGGRRRYLPFLNRYDEPELFLERFEPPPRYVDGDPAEVITRVALEHEPAGLADLGTLGLLRWPDLKIEPLPPRARPAPRRVRRLDVEQPRQIAEPQVILPHKAKKKKKRVKRRALRPLPPPIIFDLPLTPEEEHEEELLLLRVLKFI